MTAVDAGPRRSSQFVGTGELVRFALRRDRVLLPTWVLALAGVAAASAAATTDLYPTLASRLAAAQAVNASPAIVALYGPLYDPTSLGALALFKLTAFGAVVVGIAFTLLVVRHTRSEEDAGRLELVGAGAVGRLAPLSAAGLVVLIAAAALALATATGLAWAGLPVHGSIAFAVGWAGTGLVFGAVGACTAQVAATRRTATGLGLMAVATAYALRVIADSTDLPALAWLSPIGWMQLLRPFADERWIAAAPPLIGATLLISVAFALRDRRDLGAGLLPDRPGPGRGRIHGLLTLAMRLQRGQFVSWLVGVAVMAAVVGAIARSAGDFATTDAVREYLTALGGTQQVADAFVAAEIALLGTIIAAYGVHATLRLRVEEAAGRVDALLAAGVDRVPWALSYVAAAAVAVAVLALVGGFTTGLTYGLALGDLGEVGALTAAALAHVPASWVLIGIAAAAFGWAPRAAVPVTWALYGAFVVVAEFGPLWGLPLWIRNLAPFTHSPLLPGGETSWTGLGALTITSVALVLVGLLRWHRRDIGA